MSRLTADTTRGIWAGMTLSWDEHDRFDEDIYAQNVAGAIEWGVHGIYTTGSTGEFYALTHDEFCRMVDIEAELCGQAGMPLQIGCNADATYKVLRMLEYVAGKPEVGAAQVTVPYWMELTDREMLQFFQDLYTACPDLPLVYYNVHRAKRLLYSEDYLRVLEVAPSLIGVKHTIAGSQFGRLQSDIMRTPNISYFVGESTLVSAMQLGARGSYSSVVCINPRFMLDMYAEAEAGNWEQGIRMQQLVSRFFSDVEGLLSERGEGMIDPVTDKGLAVASGAILGHQRCRAPYIGWSDETIVVLRAWLEENYPELIYRGG